MVPQNATTASIDLASKTRPIFTILCAGCAKKVGYQKVSGLAASEGELSSLAKNVRSEPYALPRSIRFVGGPGGGGGGAVLAAPRFVAVRHKIEIVEPLRTQAPFRGLHSSAAISALVRYNLTRAGIQAPTHGAHQFRHALATRMLHHGTSLAEIGDVLRHHDAETTKIYTKVDLDSLRGLALPWPGGAR